MEGPLQKNKLFLDVVAKCTISCLIHIMREGRRDAKQSNFFYLLFVWKRLRSGDAEYWQNSNVECVVVGMVVVDTDGYEDNVLVVIL